MLRDHLEELKQQKSLLEKLEERREMALSAATSCTQILSHAPGRGNGSTEDVYAHLIDTDAQINAVYNNIRQLKYAVLKALDAKDLLDTTRGQALILKHLEGHTAKEVAEILGLRNPGSVYHLVREAIDEVDKIS